MVRSFTLLWGSSFSCCGTNLVDKRVLQGDEILKRKTKNNKKERMKRAIKAAFVVAMVMCAVAAQAQKLGRIQFQEVVMAMPEMQAMQANLETFSRDLSDNLEAMQVEFNNKLADYQGNLNNYTDSVRSLKEKELQDLQTRMQQFEQSARQEIQTKQSELLNPIVTKARDAVSRIAAQGGYDVVYDESAGALAFVNETTVTDIAPQVKAALGVK